MAPGFRLEETTVIKTSTGQAVGQRFDGNLYPVQFDPHNNTILHLTLMAGDKLEW